MINRKKLLQKITAAKQQVHQAEQELDQLLTDINVAPRSEKMVITNTIKEAFTKVKTARTFLLHMEKLVSNGEE